MAYLFVLKKVNIHWLPGPWKRRFPSGCSSGGAASGYWISSGQTDKPPVTRVCKEFLQARKIVDKRVRHELHVKTLSVYLESNTPPKGLTLSLKPATSDLSAADRRAWDEILNRASLDLMRVLITHSKTTATNLRDMEERLTSTKLSAHDLKELA